MTISQDSCLHFSALCNKERETICYNDIPLPLCIQLNTQIVSLCLNFFHLLARKPNLEKKVLFIQTNSFIIFTCPNPVSLVTGFGQVGLREDCCFSEIKHMSHLHLALETI
jgi:hypothetical protein